MRITLAILILSIAAPAFAEKLSCSFTEPFFSLYYDSSTGVLEREEYNFESEQIERKTVASGVTVVRAADVQAGDMTVYPTYELKDASGKLILTLVQNMNGSDGMSDMVFPYDGKLNVEGADESANHMIGGCETDLHPAIMPNNGLFAQ